MKRMILGLFALMIAFMLTSTQAFAADQRKDTSKSQYGDTSRTQSKFGQDTKKVAAADLPRASDLMDKKVKNDQGQDLGKVEDMILTRDGRISYLIIGSGGFLGVGDKYIPVPFKSAQWNAEQRVVILPNMDKDRLQNAPSINKNDFAQLEDPSFEQKVNSYYGQQTGQMGKEPALEEQMKKEQHQPQMQQQPLTQPQEKEFGEQGK